MLAAEGVLGFQAPGAGNEKNMQQLCHLPRYSQDTVSPSVAASSLGALNVQSLNALDRLAAVIQSKLFVCRTRSDRDVPCTDIKRMLSSSSSVTCAAVLNHMLQCKMPCS